MERTDWMGTEIGNLALSIARTPDEIEALQRLRYRVFTDELAAVFPSAVGDRDVDHFDDWCAHFQVRDTAADRVVGTYRVLTPEAAVQAGGYYSESEFDLSPLRAMRPHLVEVGRSCIDADFRHGGVIMLLWSGLAQIMMHGGYRYMLGCASVSLRDDGVAAAEVWRIAQRLMARDPAAPRIVPIHRYPVERLDSTLPARVPPLIKGYLKIGATICGEPAWDPDFNTADFPILLDLERLDPRYRRHFGMD
ncbi:GNAT family N-acyltransferase [Castellaniella sp. GW247-6E4]|uniref:GNAT family N-acetyltransferase n=1 Tax=Castellaniella sp. GW247-6E4 TaxID=3140380 RepID=UPI0033148D8D